MGSFHVGPALFIYTMIKEFKKLYLTMSLAQKKTLADFYVKGLNPDSGDTGQLIHNSLLSASYYNYPQMLFSVLTRETKDIRQAVLVKAREILK